MKLTDLDLDAIQARAEETTDYGPWREDTTLLMERPTESGTTIWPLEPEDAEFIAHARGDVPALVAEVRRLRAELAGGGAR